MKEKIDSLNKRGWGLIQNLGLMGGITFLLLAVLKISRWINKGNYDFVSSDTFAWPEYLFISLAAFVIVVFILLTINKTPVWLWVEKVKGWFKKEES